MHTVLNRYQDWGLLALRLAIGAIFLYHGTQKWPMLTSAPEGMDSTMLMIFRILAIAEPLGGAAVLVGFLTRYASLGLAIIMLGATYFKMMVFQSGFAGTQGAGWEFDLIILAGCIALMTFGSGKLGVDAMMGKK